MKTKKTKQNWDDYYFDFYDELNEFINSHYERLKRREVSVMIIDAIITLGIEMAKQNYFYNTFKEVEEYEEQQKSETGVS